jgi:hypothetical protein
MMSTGVAIFVFLIVILLLFSGGATADAFWGLGFLILSLGMVFGMAKWADWEDRKSSRTYKKRHQIGKGPDD